MTDLSSTQFVQQAFFGWSYSSRRVGLVACSSDSKDDRQRWNARLDEHIRLEGVPQAEKNCSALSYIDFGDGEVAVLHRMPSGYSEGRNDSHALIGPADVLTTTVALGLEEWSWLNDRPANQWMMPLSAAQFVNVTEDDLAHRLRPLAVRTRARIRAALSALLDNPNVGLSIIGCPRAERLPLLWALRGAADDYLRQYAQTRRPWTFSTHEVRHEDTVENLPAVIFLPTTPEGTGYSSRTTVDLTPGREPSPAVHEELAVDLLGRFLDDGQTFVPARAAEPVGVETPRTPSPASHPAQHFPYEVTGAAAAGHGGVPDASAHLRALRTATRGQEVLRALEKLASSASSPKQRAALRNALDVDTVNHVSRVVEAAISAEVAPTLTTVAYGPQHVDLPEAIAHATTLIAGCESDAIAKAVSKAARPHGENQVVGAAYHRWANGRNPSLAPPVRGTQHTATRPQKTKRDKKALAIGVGAALGALTIAFLLGIIVAWPGEPRNENPSAASPAGTTDNAAPPSISALPAATPKSATLPPIGTVTLEQKPTAVEQVFSFVRVGQQYYPQSPCVLADSAGTWQCARTSAPSDVPATEPALVAYVIPAVEAPEMQRLATEGKPTTHKPGWRDEKQVRAG